MKDNTCRCGQPIPDSKARNPRKWCSEACRVRCHRLDNPKPRKPKPERVKAEPVTQTWDCGYCGITCTRPATRGQKPRWCSTECRLKGGYQKNLCADCSKPGIRNGSIRCSECATLKAAQRGRETAQASRIAARRTAAQRRLDKAAQGTAARSIKVSAHCIICTTNYVTIWYGNHATTRTCSDTCAKERLREERRQNKDRRRARKKNAFVANVYRKKVFEADGYRCHLCNKKTDPTKPAPHPKAPTVDHIIPLAAGGTHEPSNCRTACFLCNSRKGDRGGGEQFALVA